MTMRPRSQVARRPADAAGKAEERAALLFRVGAPCELLDLTLLRWEVAETARRRCPALSPQRRDDLVLVVDELATNAIRHAGGGLVNVTLAAGADAVSARVYDGTAAKPRLRDPDEATEDGRGLRLVDELTGHRWGHRPTPSGKYVWARVPYDLPRGVAAGASAK